MTSRIFVSYSHADQQWAKSFIETLKIEGLEVWFDTAAMNGGESWSESLQKSLRASSTIIILLNEENAQSPNHLFELGAALGMNKRVILVVSKDLNVKKLPLPLRLVQYVVRTSPKETAREVASAIELPHQIAA
jgi:hypothetical protein